MKRMNLALLSGGLVVVLCLFMLPVSIQGQEQEAQGYLMTMTDYAVKPSMAKEFEAATIAENGLFAGINFPYGWTAYSTDDFHYYFFTPMGSDFASLDALGTAFDEAEAKLGENYKALEKRMEGTYEYYRDTVIYFRPDLSNTSAKSYIKPEEAGYILFELTYILPGKEEEFETYCKEWAALCQRIGFRIGYATYSGVIGTDMPFYLWATTAKAQVDGFVEEERIMKILSPEEQAELGAAYEKAFAFFRKIENKNGRSRPDLSYTPEEQKPVK